ncbi:MAG TPA: phosphoribosylglycinamide formyltransferase [Salinivirgaceae bacterium]|nr:phosphoribosylglycinamide formyltransferase [Salinivirgaceae bacterium]
MGKTNIGIFASGSGSNAEVLINYFKFHPTISVNAVFTDNSKAPVIERATRLKTPVVVFEQTQTEPTGYLHQKLDNYDINFIVLAGYLKLIPDWLVLRFHNRMVNIHPALLPKYGGKGMYGNHVHKAVIAAGEKESGITIHLVDKEYDSGKILFQEKCSVDPNDTPETLAAKIHRLEHKFYPMIIEKYISSLR